MKKKFAKDFKTNFKTKISQNRVKVISSVVAVLAIITMVMTAIYHANKKQNNQSGISPELAKAMTYDVIEDKDAEAAVDGTSNVKFDAFFLRDVNGDGYAESIRGTSKEIGAEDTLYMELNVVSEGYLENATISINGENFYLQTTLPKDNELADNYIGNNIKEIKLNRVNNGTQKLLTGIVRSGDYSQSSKKAEAIGNNINNYSKVNSITLTGTYVNGQGEKVPVTKTVEFNIDWYGKTAARINTTNQNKDIDQAMNEEEDTINLDFTINTEETNKELILSKNHVEGEIPELNGYAPIEVIYTGSNGVFHYDAENRTFTIDRTAEANEEGKVTNAMPTSNSYGIRVVYPMKAYESLGAEAVTIKIPVKTYYEGYNNPSEEFTNPYKSNIAQSTVVVTYEKHTGDVSSFDISVGKLVYSPTRRYIISKQKPLKIYNGQSEEETEDTYLVTWKGNVGANEEGVELGGMVMKETRNDAEETTGENNQTAGIEQVTDQFIKTDGTEESADEIVSNVGIYFTGADTLLGEEGWIKVYDEDTGNLLVTFTQNDWNKYTSSNPYKYEIPVKHIRVETSAIKNNNTSLYVYNIKEIDDEKITTKYTREQFDELQYIKSTLVGYISGTYIETDTNQANYEAPISIANISISNNTISTQSTEKNEKLTIEAYADETANQVKWQNGTFLVKLPEEIIDAQINNVTINNPSVSLESYELIEQDGTLFIKIVTKNNTPQTFYITVDIDLSPDPRIATTTKPIELYASNENGSDYYYKAQDIYDVNNNLNIEEQVNHTTTNISMVSPNSLLTNQTATDYDDKGSEIVSPEIADIKPSYVVVDQEQEEQTAKIGVQLKNNYSSTISEIQILGKIPFEGNTYVLSGGDLGSTFTTKITDAGIEVPAELAEIATVYYSDNENPDKDINKAENNWKTADQVENWDNIKTFLIDLGDYVMESGKEFVFNYTVKIPNGLEFNQVAYSHHGVYFCLDTDQGKYRTETEPNKLGFRIAEKYDLELTKYQTGKDKLVPGATYSVTEIETVNNDEGGEEVVTPSSLTTEIRGEAKTAVTNSQGKLSITNLYAEKEYEIREIKSPDDYELNTNVIRFIGHVDDEGNLSIEKTEGTTKGEITVTKEEGQNYKVNIQVEDEVKAALKITKKEQGTDTSIQGVRFKLTGYNLSENGRNLTTNANGELTFNGLSVNQEYTLQEVRAEGYYLANPITFKIVNNDGNYTVEKIEDETEETINQTITEEDGIPTINITLENEKIPTYSMQLIKVKKTTESTVSDDELIAKAETALAGTEVEYLAGAKFKLYKGTEEVGEYTTDETGTVTIDNLYQYETEKGIDQTYTLKEVLAPEGYAKVKDITFKVEEVDGTLVLTTINEEGQEQKGENYVAEGNTIRLTIEDSPSFKLIKKDAETQQVLAGVKFAIYNVDDGSEQPATNSKGEIIGTKETINGKEYYTVSTDENGEITADLTEGLYKAVEVQAPDQYDISGSTYYFGIGASREAPTTMSATQVMAIGGSNNDRILSVAPTSDGGYIAGGYFSSTIQIGNNTLTSKGGTDGIIIKYSTEGEVEWFQQIGESGNEYIRSVSVTDEGDIIIGGDFTSKTIQIGKYEIANKSSSDGMIIKYTAEREVEWVTTIPGSWTDTIYSVSATNDGGVIVGGYFGSGNSWKLGDYEFTSKGVDDGIVIKYSSEGEVEWVQQIGGTNIDIIRSVSQISDGGYIVGGYFQSSSIQVGEYTLTNNGYSDGMLIKYSSTGEVEWARSVEGNNHACITSVASTNDGGYIAGGYFNSSIQVGEYTLTSNGYSDGMLIKYTEEGEVEWATSVGSTVNDAIQSVSETSDGGIITGGYFQTNSIQIGDHTFTNKGMEDGMIIKYTREGEVEWARSVGGNNHDYITSVAETTDGVIVVGGYFQSSSIQLGDCTLTNNGSEDGMIIKLEKKELNNPITLQAQAIGGSSTDKITSVASTSDGGYVVGGYFSSSEIKIGENVLENKGSNDGFVAKYSQTGEIEWIKQIGGNDDDQIKSVAETSDGGYVVGGSFKTHTIQLDDYILTNHSWQNDGLIIKYNSKGELEWAKAIGDSTNSSDSISSVAPTNDGGIIAGGSFTSKEIQLGDYTLTNNGGQDGMIIKYSSEGEVEWATSVGESSNDYISSVASTKDGGYIAGGSFNASEIKIGDYTLTSNGFTDGILIKYNHSGEVEWAKVIGSVNQDYINSVAETNDGDIVVAGGFQSTFTIGDYKLTNSSNGYRDIMIIKFAKDGEVKWATSMGKQYDDWIQSVTPTNDGGFIVGGRVNNTNQIQSGDYALTNTTTEDGIIIKYSADNKVEWMKAIGGTSSDYIQSLTETTDGTIIAGGYFDSSSIETDGKTITNAGGQDGMLLKIANQVGVPEIQELNVENNRKEFEITTNVKEVNGVKGGNISGENRNPYETVKYGDNSTSEIVMTPDENYEIISITVNGEEYPFEANEDGTYTMPPFENMTEDKHIEVTYALKANKFTINKIDAKTQLPLQGAIFKIESTEEIEGEIYEQEVTTNSQGQAIVQLPFGTYQITEIQAPDGYELLKDPIEVEFTEESDNQEITIENNTIAKVIVHHYLKDNEGQYTTTKVAEDDVIEKTDAETYTTSPKLDLEKYELEKDENGSYIIPSNATGNFISGETIEVTYYYEEKEIPLTVHHYIEGTTQPVPLKDGTEAEDEQKSGKEGTTYQTSEFEDGLLSDAYEIAEIPENAQGTYTGEEVIVTYYYKRVERPVTIVKTGEEGEALEGVTFEIAAKDNPEEILGTFTTNEEGKISITLPSGEYIAKETEVPENYQLPEESETEFTVTKQEETISVEITNTKKKGEVITHHYIEGTEEKVPALEGGIVEDVTQTGNVGDTYATKPVENIANNYEYVSSTDNTSGEIVEGTIEVIYYYKLKEPVITESEITKESETEKVTEENQAIDYTINYQTTIDTYIGKATVTIVDELPYEIDEARSNIAGGAYDSEEKTITWIEEISNIDTFINDAKEISIEKEISLVYKDIDVTQANIENRVTGTVRLETPEKEETVEDTKEIPTEYLVNIPVTKVWNDKEDVARKRPSAVEVVIKNGAEEVGRQELNAGNKWSYTFENLPKYDDLGNKVGYTVEEHERNLGDLYFYDANVSGSIEEGYTITNTFTVPDERIELTVNKTWVDNDIQANRRPETIVINVKAKNADNNDPEAVIDTYELNTETETSHTFTDLPKYNSLGNEITYTVEEQEKTLGDLHFYTSTVSEVTNIEDEENKKEATITNTFTTPIDTVNVIANKIWNDNDIQANRRPESVNLVVKNGDEEVKTVEISKDNMVEGTTNQWSIVIDGLQKYDDNGEEIQYTVEEREKNANDLKFYIAEENIVAVEDYQATIRNSFVKPSDKTSVIVNKVWSDNNNVNGKRPESIRVKVTGNGQTYTQEINAINNETEENSNEWTYTFTDLPKYDENGQEIIYTASEEEVNSGDLKFYTNDGTTGDMESGYTITNTFTVPDERIELTVNKNWVDNSTQAQRRPETIVINVKAENADNNDPDTVIDTYELNTETEISHTFTNLPKYNSKGDEIIYKVEEQEKNPGDLHFYTSSVGSVETTSANSQKVTITNTFTKPDDKTEVTVIKVWNDNNDEAKKRPESINLQLKNRNVVEDEQEVNESNKVDDQRKEEIIAEINANKDPEEQISSDTVEVWQYTFTEVEKYNEDGQEIAYTVDETEVNNNDLQFYNKTISGLTVTNTFTQDTTKVEVSVTKIWEDNEIQAQRRPESVVIVLKANGIENQRYELSEETAETVNDNTWTYTFKELAKYDEYNNIINYTIEEEEKTQGDLKFYTSKVDGYTITNRFTRPTDTIRIEVHKEWVDQENAYEKRPNSIRLEVNQGENVIQSEVVTQDENWSATFIDLPKYDENGQEIEYTVDEEEVMENDLFNYEKEIGEITDKNLALNEKEATITNTMTKIPSTVEVKYVDKYTGEEIAEERTKEGIIGDTFDVTEDKKDITGYTLVEEPEEKEGVYTAEPQEKIYYYAKNTRVIVKYLEQDNTPDDIADNQVLADEVTIEGYEGKEYTTTEETIPGYTLVATTDNLEGTMERDEIVVIYYYAPNTNVIVKYLEQDNTPNDNSDNQELAPEVNIEGYVGKDYTTVEEEIPGYTLVATTENTEGTMTKDPIEVIYYYAQNTKVIVKYLEKDDTPEDNTDNQVLAKEITIEGHAGQEYTTEQKDIENYTFVESTNNTEGTMTKDVIEVIYYYAQNTKATVQHIDRETGEILKEESQDGKVGDLFETKAEDFDGYVLVEVPEEPNIIMDKTGEQVVKYYYAHVSAGVIEKHIDDITGELLYSEEHQGNEGDRYNIPAKEFEGYDLVTEDTFGNSRLPDNAEGEMKRDEVIEVKYYYIKKAKVIVKYLEEDDTPEDTTDNQVLAEEEIIEGHENDDYETEAKEIEGYDLVEIPDNAIGTMVITKNPDGTYNTEIEVIYYYKKVAGGVIENHIDITTNEILASEEHKGNVGDTYDIPSREFEGYDLVIEDENGNSMLPTNAKGEMTEEQTVVNYYYIKQAKVKVEYIDKQTGEKLDEEEIKGHIGDSYNTEEKEFDGYELVEKPSNSTGEMTEEETVVKYYYARKAEVEVKYLEKGTEYEIAERENLVGYVGDNYETTQKDIPYYKFVEKTENYKGTMQKDKITVIYYYEKQVFNLGIDKWVSSVNVNGISQGAKTINNKDEMYVVDIHRSKTDTANVKVTYKIRVTNKGEIEGTAKEITEVIPAGYSYYQEDNEIHWEERYGSLVTEALKDETIEPGEYKEIEIVLRWNPGENNFGEKENLVILSGEENPAGYEDVDKGDNHSSSDMMITVATGLDRNGRIILTASITMVLSIILAVNVGLLVAYKEKQKKKK